MTDHPAPDDAPAPDDTPLHKRLAATPMLRDDAIARPATNSMVCLVGNALCLPFVSTYDAREVYALSDTVLVRVEDGSGEFEVVKARWDRAMTAMGLTRYGFDVGERFTLDQLQDVLSTRHVVLLSSPQQLRELREAQAAVHYRDVIPEDFGEYKRRVFESAAEAGRMTRDIPPPDKG